MRPLSVPTRPCAPEASVRCLQFQPSLNSAPNLAQLQAPLMAQAVRDNSLVKSIPLARDVLAKNLKKLMNRGGKKLTPRDVARTKYWQERGETGPISAKTVERMEKAVGHATLDHLDEVAKFFAVQPWQLLVPGFDPEKLPHLALSDEAKAAFEKIGRHFAELRGEENGPQ